MISIPEWQRLRRDFDSSSYWDLEDQNGNENCISKWMCRDAKMEDLPPRLLEMIFDLKRTIDKLEIRIEELEEMIVPKNDL